MGRRTCERGLGDGTVASQGAEVGGGDGHKSHENKETAQMSHCAQTNQRYYIVRQRQVTIRDSTRALEARAVKIPHAHRNAAVN